MAYVPGRGKAPILPHGAIPIFLEHRCLCFCCAKKGGLSIFRQWILLDEADKMPMQGVLPAIFVILSMHSDVSKTSPDYTRQKFSTLGGMQRSLPFKFGTS